MAQPQTQNAPIDVAINDTVIEQLLAMMVRCPSLFSSARDFITPNHFNKPNEVPYKAIWCATIEYYKEHGKLPNKHVLETEAVRFLADSSEYSEVNEEIITALLDWIFDENENSAQSFDLLHGQYWLKQLATDRRVGALLRDMDNSEGRVVQIPKILEISNNELRRIATISAAPQMDVIPDDWGVANPTGPSLEFDIGFLDNHLATYPGDVNIILGGTGGGKTMLCTQMLTAAGKVQRRKVARGGTGKLCVYFGCEGESRDPRIRVMSYAAKILKRRLENMQSYNELSTTKKLEEYERQHYKYIFGNNAPMGERERLEAEKPWINEYLRLYDFSGSKGADGVSRGFGGVAELRQMLENEQQTSGREIGLVIVDWAGMLLRRYIEATGRNVSQQLTAELTTFVDKLHYEIAEPFNCTVFVAHQLRGIVNRSGPTHIATHADAEYCSMFAANAWFSLVLGTKDEDTNAVTLSYTKTRRGEGKKGLVLWLNGDFAHFEEASNKFQLDHAAKKIIEIGAPKAGHNYKQYDNTEDNDIDNTLTAGIESFG